MKVIIDLKDDSKRTDFKKNDIIICDGKKWYVTTVDELCAHITKRCDEYLAKIDRKVNELNQSYATFMQQYHEQNAKLLPIIEKILEEDEEK